MRLNQRDTLATLRSALRSEAHVLERWPHLVGQQLHHYCARRGERGARASAILERHLEGRRWIRRATCFGRPVPSGQWALGRGREIIAARLTRDGRYAVALTRGSCVVWATATGELVSELALGSAGPAVALAVAPSGNAIAIGHGTGCCSLWDPAAGSLLFQWQAHEHPIEAVALADEPRSVATFGGTAFTKTLRIWQPPSTHAVRERVIEDTKIVESMAGRLQQGGVTTIKAGRAVRCVSLDFLAPQDSVLCAQPGIAQAWNWSRDEIVWRTERPPRWWAGGVVSYEHGIVAAHALDGPRAFIVADESGAVERSPASNGSVPGLGSVAKAVFSADASVYLVSNTRGECRIGWQAPDGWHEHAVDLGGAAHVDITDDGRLVIGAADDRCNLFDVRELTSRTADLDLDGKATGAVFTTDGAACTLGGYSELVHVHLASAVPLWRSRLAEGALSGCARAARAPVVAASSRHGTVLIVDDGSPGDSRPMRVEGQEFTCVAVSADASRVAAGSASGAVLIWEPATGGKYRSIQVWEAAITALFWLTGTTLAVAGETEDVRIVDVRRPRRQVSLRAHEAWVTCLGGPVDQGILLSGGMDGRICLWEPDRSPEPRAVWRDSIEPAAVAWLPGARVMASVDARGVLRLRSESGSEVGLCPLDGAPVALECLDGNRAGYVNASGEVSVLSLHGFSIDSQPPVKASTRSGLGALWHRWTKE